MSDAQNIDELSLEELEYIVAERRREERERRFAESGDPRYQVRERKQKKTREPNPPRRWRDRLLLVVEIVAALGLIAIIVLALSNLQTLNNQVAQMHGANSTGAGAAPAGELPGSSFPPANDTTELPGSSFPPEPAPPALGVRLQRVAALPIPTPGPRSPTRIVIPAINVDWPIVPGDSWEELKQGVGHRIGSANPGERGNLILSGHDDVYGEPFRDLEKLDAGKEVFVYAGASAFRYVIKAKRVVVPNDLSVLEPSRNPIITLITCTPYRVDTHRLILIGDLKP